jgi:hypothetical protein
MRIEACPEFKKIEVTQYVCFLSQAFSEKSLEFSEKDRIFLKGIDRPLGRGVESRLI